MKRVCKIFRNYNKDVGSFTEFRDWQMLITALALHGYSVYADEEQISFEIGDNDLVIEELEER